jgi:predicted outer membrane repeat protein
VSPTTRFSRRPLGTIGASGALSVQVPLLEIGAQPMRPLFGQVIVLDADNRVVMSGPVHVLVTNCALIAPDCNGNGSWDYCDLADGTSDDSNGNDIADECEFTRITHVDASAPSGGDGSEAFPFQTIQEGVDGSPDFQVVRVHDGVYGGFFNRNIDLEDRVLHIESANGPENCHIDLEDSGIAFFVQGIEIEPIRIAGFTIVNGRSGGYPGAVGGGIDVSNSDPTIENCVFQNCSGSQAGAISGRFTNVRIRGCRFVDNQSTSGAGAVSLDPPFGSAPGPVEIVDCFFSGNSSTLNGGAVRLAPGDFHEARMSHCVVMSNSATGGGGGIYVRTIGGQPGSAVRIEDCLIVGNAASIGGGVYYDGSGGLNPTKAVRHCTIVGNTATNHGGGVSARVFLVGNSVVWGNSAPLGAQLSVPNSGTLTVRNSDVQGGQAEVHVVLGGSLSWGTGNIDLDPLFVDADGLDDSMATFDDNDYRLSVGSPCIDAGSNTMMSDDFFDLDGDSVIDEPVPLDLDFLPRLVGALVDMGAYEKQP